MTTSWDHTNVLHYGRDEPTKTSLVLHHRDDCWRGNILTTEGYYFSPRTDRIYYTMRYRIPLNSRILLSVPAIQGGRSNVAHPRTLATIGSRPATDHMETPRPKTKLGVERETLYIGGGLAAIGAVWYYYATVEHARIEKKRERLNANITALGSANEGPGGQGAKTSPVEQGTRSSKGRT